ncbi:MAG: tRNA preQ1(34) S-adenosylmethionine ribosyltransferase-isomerase QueA [Planctomycetota bacterium]|nr:tRNA preQ1(34) S-adenosylmethionine ribosyltransferase-isomerase QueA [Planctomycetota bacterium]
MPDADKKISDFDYVLPPERIAQSPARPRDASRLMLLDRRTGAVAHHRFHELPDLLLPTDLLVVNDTRVIPAAFTARRSSGARIEGLFLRTVADGLWEVLLQGRGRLREGQAVALVAAAGEERATLELVGRGEGGSWRVRPPAATDALRLLDAVGRPPLPPYIRRKGRAAALGAGDREDYQTVYARRDGAVAAPTAGLHFTPRVLERLAARGIGRVAVTLHVGVGTFQPVRVERLADHLMHEEFAEISAEAAAEINRARSEGRRIVAVGTTTVRALESAAGDGGVQAGGRWTDIFIRPPHRFRAVDALVTNFHLPRSTLLVLVSAFAGRERILAAYAEAIQAGYRFYSYGDAMLIV